MGAYKNLCEEAEENNWPDYSEFCDYCQRLYKDGEKVYTKKSGGYYCSKFCRDSARKKEKNETTR